MESKRQHSYPLISSEASVKGVFSACVWETLSHLRVGEMCVFYFFRINHSILIKVSQAGRGLEQSFR